MKSSRYYFHNKTKTLADFQICISVPLNLWEGSAYVSSFKSFKRIANMPEFWIFRVTQDLPIFINMIGVWICVGMQLWKGSECFRIPNMPCFCICNCCTTFWICLNMAQYMNKLFWLWQYSEYAWSKFHRVSNMPPALNMPGLWIWQGCICVNIMSVFERSRIYKRM